MIRRTKLNKITRLLIFLPAAVLGLLAPSSVDAQIESGLKMTVYNNFGYNANPPLPTTSGRPLVGETTVSRVQQNFDQSPPFEMYEDFIVRYEGYITSPISGSFRFWPQGDDGTQLYIEDVRIQNDWRDKGGGGAFSSYVDFENGVSKKFEMWFYENGGGAWTTLYWDIGNGWEVVPDSAFTQQVIPTTTTTIPRYLNAPQNLLVTSTNENKVYLSWEAPEVSNVDVERYAIFWSCDNWESGFAISSLTTSAVVENFEPEQSCQFKVRADNDSLSIYSDWSNEVTGVTLPTTTTSTTTTSTTTTTIVQEEVQQWTTTTVLTPPVTVTIPPPSTSSTTGAPVGTTTSTLPVQTTVLQQTEQPQTTTTTLPPTVLNTFEELKSVVFSETATSEQVAEAVSSIIKDGVSAEQATELATSAKVLSSIDAEQATEIFEAIDISSVSEEEAEQIIAAVQEAPKEIRQAFEEEINVFDGALDTYVPLGSSVPVGTRRALIAFAAVVAAVPAAPVVRR